MLREDIKTMLYPSEQKKGKKMAYVTPWKYANDTWNVYGGELAKKKFYSF